MIESVFQSELIKELRELFPGCLIMKNDSSYMQGIPDLTILYGARWAMLEVKANARAKHQANQDYYVDLLDGMSFAAFIYPENKEEIIRGLQSALNPRRIARFPKRE